MPAQLESVQRARTLTLTLVICLPGLDNSLFKKSYRRMFSLVVGLDRVSDVLAGLIKSNPNPDQNLD